jgi:hypothetical protein
MRSMYANPAPRVRPTVKSSFGQAKKRGLS